FQPDAGDVFEASVAVDQQVEDEPLVLDRDVSVLDPVLDPALLRLVEMKAQDFTPAPRLDKQMPPAPDHARAGLDGERFLDAGAQVLPYRLGVKINAFHAGVSGLALASRIPARSWYAVISARQMS